MLELNGTSLLFIISFLLFAFLLNFVLWEPIRKIKSARSSDLNEQLNSAHKAEEKTHSIILQVKKETETLRKNELALIEKVFAECKIEEEQEEAKLKKEFELLKDKTALEIKFDRDNLIQSLEPEANKLAQIITEKVMQLDSLALKV
ncbi:MAG: hypothetical protein ACK481_11015 [Candidatus Melainabacteria bacterium]|jgi:F0F1-type ATP synthase membrane subunit b/b'